MKIVLGHNSAADCPTFAKYSVGKHDSCQSRSNCKFRKFNTTDGTILKIVKSPSQLKIIRFWWIRYTTADLELDDCHIMKQWHKYHFVRFQWIFFLRKQFSQNFDNGTDIRVPQNIRLVLVTCVIYIRAGHIWGRQSSKYGAPTESRSIWFLLRLCKN